MGMRLVGLALTKWAPHTPDRAFKILIRMAFSALDDPTPDMPANVFFGGREQLIDMMHDTRGGSRESLERGVERAISLLVKMGAIERVNRPFAGQRAIYRVTLDKAIRIDGGAVDNLQEPDSGVGHSPTSVSLEPDSGVGHSPTSVSLEPDTEVGPRRQEETLRRIEEQDQEQRPDVVDQVTVARADAEKPIEKANSECGNATCAKGFILVNDRIEHCPECHPNVIQFPRTA